MELLLGYEILESYKRLSYKEWYALAEFIDNSTQSFRNNREELDEVYQKEGNTLHVAITFNNIKPTDFLQIKDNAYGMSLEELQRALVLGKKPENDRERSKYGLGLKTASFWFGDIWTIRTSKLNSEFRYSVTVDLNAILEAEKAHNEIQDQLPIVERVRFVPQLDFKTENCEKGEHGTTIIINSLNRRITPAKARRCKAFLRSIYRVDLNDKILKLTFQDDEITWKNDDFLNRLYNDKSGEKMYRKFDLKVGKHNVVGWAGILKIGSRQDAGFSLLQADRVIQGTPDAYRPTSLFGEQEGGTNNLINQRLIGELFLDGFEVSHTKNEILFQEDEEELLDKALFEKLADFKKFAEDLRTTDVVEEEAIDFESVAQYVMNDMLTPEFRAMLLRREVLPIEIIKKTNLETYERISNSGDPTFNVVIDKLHVEVIISNSASPYDPYVVIITQAKENHLTIILNKNHSYYRELNTKETVYEFIKNCVFDGVAEWKAIFIANSLYPDTIKSIKDHLLRVPVKFPF
jgi:hypothetical protein